jgi:hypothetical protein
MLVTVRLSVAEVLDRITIDEVKLDYIQDQSKRRNIIAELEMLKASLNGIDLPREVGELVPVLRRSNDENFRQIDVVFDCEAKGDYGPRYVAASRAAYVANADRAKIKRRINVLMESEIVEEKTF